MVDVSENQESDAAVQPGQTPSTTDLRQESQGKA